MEQNRDRAWRRCQRARVIENRASKTYGNGSPNWDPNTYLPPAGRCSKSRTLLKPDRSKWIPTDRTMKTYRNRKLGRDWISSIPSQ